jgi:hypothetical protein
VRSRSEPLGRTPKRSTGIRPADRRPGGKEVPVREAPGPMGRSSRVRTDRHRSEREWASRTHPPSGIAGTTPKASVTGRKGLTEDVGAQRRRPSRVMVAAETDRGRRPRATGPAAPGWSTSLACASTRTSLAPRLHRTATLGRPTPDGPGLPFAGLCVGVRFGPEPAPKFDPKPD